MSDKMEMLTAQEQATKPKKEPAKRTKAQRRKSPTSKHCKIRRNPALLIQWIIEHPLNLYPTREEKSQLVLNAGMNKTQLDYWFANTRKSIKKVGYDKWKKNHYSRSEGKLA